MVALRLTSLFIRSVRNLAQVSLAPAARLNVLFGDNGHGKTSVLEANLSRVHRQELSHRQAQGGCFAFSERCERAGERAGRRRGARAVDRPGRISASPRERWKTSRQSCELRGSIPVVVFHPGEMVLSSGPASARRTLLDRIALYLTPTSLDHAQRYALAARARQRALVLRGARAVELAAFETLMGVHGAALMRARRTASERIGSELACSFQRITAERRLIGARYEPGGPEDATLLEHGLAASRERDARRGSASIGPHRDDLVLTLGAHDARVEASQGEHRAITMALKISELVCISTGTRRVSDAPARRRIE